jgi:hypothetical protein
MTTLVLGANVRVRVQHLAGDLAHEILDVSASGTGVRKDLACLALDREIGVGFNDIGQDLELVGLCSLREGLKRDQAKRVGELRVSGCYGRTS